MSRIRILLVTRSSEFASRLERPIENHGDYKLSTKIISNGHADPLQGVTVMPDVLILHCTSSYGELQFLADSRSSSRTPLLVICSQDDPDAMRLAMRAGASDYLTAPVDDDELLTALERVSSQILTAKARAGELVSVINSRGGSGASFLAANIAYGLHNVDKVRALLIDFDLQFGGLSRYFDINPRRGIIEALDAIDDMDEVSAETYITKHESGLRLLAACTDTLHLSNEVHVDRIDALFRLLLQHNDYLVVDLPRRIDLIGATILESSDHILLVVQQSLSHIHDALRMFRLIVHELGIPKERLTIVLNRHEKKLLINTNDVKKALKVDQIVEIPNHYKTVAESIDTGKPILQSAKSSSVSRAINELQCRIRGAEAGPVAHNILERALPAILRRSN